LTHLEVQAAQDVQNLLREAVQRGAQAKADHTPPLCPVCQQKLSRLSADHPRTFDTHFGAITVNRTRGYCKRCRKWRVPADTALGLEETPGYSPAVQEMAALLELTLEPYQMIIQMDAWNIRERDDWGQSAVLRRRARNRSAGTGFTLAPTFVWITVARARAGGP